MNKKVVAVVLAGTMIASQLIGAVETLAAGTTGTQPEKALNVGRAETSTFVEEANNVEPQAKAPVKAFLADDGKVYGRNAQDASDGQEITGAALKTITDLRIGGMVTTIAADKFKDTPSLTTLSFANSNGQTTNNKLATIEASAFENTGLTSVVLPGAVTSIGDKAFANIPSLKTLDVSKATTLATIGISAFEGSDVLAVDLSKITTVLDLKANAFRGNVNLGTVRLAPEMIVLEAGVFADTALTNIEITAKCITLDITALPETLEAITVAAGNTAFAAEDGVLYDTRKTTLKIVPEKKAGELIVPSSVIRIKASAAQSNKGLTKVSVDTGSKLSAIDSDAFQDATALKELDLRKAAAITEIKTNAFKGSALASMKLGKATSDFTTKIQPDAFTSTAQSKVVEFLDDNGNQITGQDLTDLEKKWEKLKDAANGGWIFYGKPVKPAEPQATANYTDMKLEGLNNTAKYKITVDGTSAEYTTDNAGKLAIEKVWGGKKIEIVSLATSTHTESDPQELDIKAIYTVTLDNKAENKAVGETVSYTALDEAGKTFMTWTAEGVDLKTPTAKKIEFQMPGNDVTLTKVYKTTTSQPQAATDYAEMKLTGLVPDGLYTIDGEQVTADTDGKVGIKKEWGDKSVAIIKSETETDTASPVQNLPIDKIYSISVNEKEVGISTAAQAITVEAPIKEGHLFKEWTELDGITLTTGTKADSKIGFVMPAKEVTLVVEYTKIMITEPEDLKYDGEEPVSVVFDVPADQFSGIEVAGKLLVKDQDYTVAEGVTTAASGRTVITFTKAYLETLKTGQTTFKAVLADGKKVDFTIKVAEKSEEPQKPEVVFPDVSEKEWYYPAINYVSAQGLMTGYADGTFGPADSLGRGQFASILYRIAGAPAADYEPIFSDVPDGTFYSIPVLWAKRNNIITGYEEGTFGPSDSMTREQLATMLYRFTRLNGGDVTARVSIDTFPDAGKVSAFAEESMSWAVAVGIISGDNSSLNPQGISSRAVAATMLQRFQTKQPNPEKPKQP